MRSIFLATWILGAVPLGAFAQNPELERLKAADDSRIAAMLSADRDGLEASFSDELRYAHSSGVVDSKQSFVRALTEKTLRYVSYRHEERDFSFPKPGVALMTGRAGVRVASVAGEVDALLAYLAVWREEGGRWRFVAWQSCRLPVPAGSDGAAQGQVGK